MPIKHSIAYKMTVMIVAIMALSMIIAGVFGSVFMERYYTSSKKNSIKKIYTRFIKVTKTDSTIANSSNIRTINDLCEKYGATLVYMDSSGNSIYMYGPGTQLLERWKDSVFGINNNMVTFESETIDANDDYTLNYTKDKISDKNYYELISTVDNENDLVIRVSVENFKESIAIANKFYLGLGIALIVIITILMITIIRKNTSPILALADLSIKMSELDFDAKYTGNYNDEVGVLGESMNEMSDKLETTITELKNANVELHKDIKQKEEIDEMRKEFISNVSHELKTPIALIQGYAEGLKEGINNSPEDTDYYVDVIVDEASKMNKMVLSLLNLNQIEFGRIKVSIERFDIVLVTQSIVNRMKNLPEAEGIDFSINAPDKLYVFADEYMIEEVITNYVGNAIHHADGDKKIVVSITQEGNKAKVTVFNTGKNIAEQDLKQIWDKFYKVDKARTREYGGTGIGLSIVQAIMESHNNEYGVMNKEDGVEFYFQVDTEKN